jgi:hypothetical protein
VDAHVYVDVDAEQDRPQMKKANGKEERKALRKGS